MKKVKVNRGLSATFVSMGSRVAVVMTADKDADKKRVTRKAKEKK